jgi:hypothetical protein
MPKTTDSFKHLAQLGAAARLKQLDRERATILQMFPGLLHSRLVHATPGVTLTPRRKPSAAARRAMSEGMRKFWARRKAAMKK